MGQTSLAM